MGISIGDTTTIIPERDFDADVPEINPDYGTDGPEAPRDTVAAADVEAAVDALVHSNTIKAIETALDKLQTADAEPKPIRTGSGDDGCDGPAQKEPPKEQVFNPKVDINVFI